MFQDSASRDLPAQVIKDRFRKGSIELGMLVTEISSVALHTPNLFTIAIGSSAEWEKHYLFTWIKRSWAEEGEKKLSELKAKVFDHKTKKERVARALKLLSEIKPIEGLDKATWKSIVEETSLEDTYGD